MLKILLTVINLQKVVSMHCSSHQPRSFAASLRSQSMWYGSTVFWFPLAVVINLVSSWTQQLCLLNQKKALQFLSFSVEQLLMFLSAFTQQRVDFYVWKWFISSVITEMSELTLQCVACGCAVWGAVCFSCLMWFWVFARRLAVSMGTGGSRWAAEALQLHIRTVRPLYSH